jgi:hypothetical protein
MAASPFSAIFRGSGFPGEIAAMQNGLVLGVLLRPSARSTRPLLPPTAIAHIELLRCSMRTIGGLLAFASSTLPAGDLAPVFPQGDLEKVRMNV